MRYILGAKDAGVDELLLEEPVTKQGGVWLLGKYRLIFGDSRNLETYKELMNSKKVNLIVTAPPYNIDYEKSVGAIENDNMSEEKFYDFLVGAY